MELNVNIAIPDSLPNSRLISSPVPAGQPQSVEDSGEFIDLNDYVAGSSRDNIFYINVSGDSMTEYGIRNGDLLVADRAKQPRNGDVVIAEVEGSFTVKRFVNWQRNFYLVPENENYKTRRIEDHEDFAVWGVVTHVVHRLT